MNLQELKKAVDLIDANLLSEFDKIIEDSSKIIILGNGGSNAIASHISQDYTKVLGKQSVSFSDPSRLTCYINDYGMSNAYSKFLDHFCNGDELVILISSSGESVNILNAAEYCVNHNIPMVTLSGFKPDNSLRSKFGPKSLCHFWVESQSYGVVECVHQIILHSPA